MYVLRRIGGWHRPLVLHAGLMFGLAVWSFVGLFADDRLLLGEPVWAKPMKFGIAMGIYSLTLAWLLTLLTKGRRVGWWVGTGFAVAGALDVGAVVWAAAHGTFSHFNQESNDVARTVQTVFSFGIMPLIIATLIIAVLLLMQRTGDRALTLALRAGLGLAFASMVVAGWLSASGGGYQRTEVDANGQLVSLVGQHGIGDPDGRGMFLTNWSTSGGDLRVPHFVGLHAIQVLLAAVALLHLLAGRMEWLRPERVRARLVGVVAFGYTGSFVILSWQAARGQSVVHPDAVTLVAFGAVVLLGAAGVRWAASGPLREAELASRA
ncbi:hypothetical protein ACQP00_30975 [Dactylosporangium sp. CS-047395]|uniref:hypothetical protein n=1 Tax=Dactylosporangium sp. CS-047395 TaxID=3239936 RepID=UPI003D9075A7